MQLLLQQDQCSSEWGLYLACKCGDSKTSRAVALPTSLSICCPQGSYGMQYPGSRWCPLLQILTRALWEHVLEGFFRTQSTLSTCKRARVQEHGALPAVLAPGGSLQMSGVLRYCHTRAHGAHRLQVLLPIWVARGLTEPIMVLSER